MDRFGHVELTPGSQHMVEDLRDAYRVMEAVIETLAPQGRERSLAITKLEESAMWAVKAIAVEQESRRESEEQKDAVTRG